MWGDDGGESGDSSWEGEADDEGCMAGPMGACCACCFALFLLPAALGLLGWNENNYVCEAKRILVAQEKATIIGCGSASALESGDLYFFSCPLVQSSLETFTPASFLGGSGGDVPAITSVSASMNVEMLLCSESCSTETKKNSAGQNVKVKKCSYSLNWESIYSDGSGFKDDNRAAQACMQGGGTYNRNPPQPSGVQLGSVTKYSLGARVGDGDGAFTLNDDLVTRLNPGTPVDLSNSSIASAYTGQSVTAGVPVAPFQYSTSNLKVAGQYLKSCTADVLGCVRVSFARSGATSPTVITQVETGGKTSSYMMPGSWGCAGSPWQAIKEEKLTKPEMIQTLQDDNYAIVWLLRITGLCLCWLAVYLFFSPIVAAAACAGDIVNWLPCGGYIQDALEGVATAIVCAMSCPLGCSCGLFVIALTWLFMRPLYGAIMMGVCVCCCGGAFAIRSSYQKPEKYNQQ